MKGIQKQLHVLHRAVYDCLGLDGVHLGPSPMGHWSVFPPIQAHTVYLLPLTSCHYPKLSQ